MRISLLLPSFLIAPLLIIIAIGCTPDSPEEYEQSEPGPAPQVSFTPQPDTLAAPVEETAEVTSREIQSPADNLLADLYDPSGPFSVQVAAHRNEYMAGRSASAWKDRGFADTHIVHTPDDGDNWYYVFLGRYGAFSNAETAAARINDAYNAGAWPKRRP